VASIEIDVIISVHDCYFMGNTSNYDFDRDFSLEYEKELCIIQDPMWYNCTIIIELLMISSFRLLLKGSQNFRIFCFSALHMLLSVLYLLGMFWVFKYSSKVKNKSKRRVDFYMKIPKFFRSVNIFSKSDVQEKICRIAPRFSSMVHPIELNFFL